MLRESMFIHPSIHPSIHPFISHEASSHEASFRWNFASVRGRTGSFRILEAIASPRWSGWCWNMNPYIYLGHLWGFYVGKYSSTMDHLGLLNVYIMKKYGKIHHFGWENSVNIDAMAASYVTKYQRVDLEKPQVDPQDVPKRCFFSHGYAIDGPF